MPKNILLVPSIRSGNGTGHLKRALKLSGEISKMPGFGSFIFLDNSPKEISRLLLAFPELEERKILTSDTLKKYKYSLIILDQRATNLKSYHKWESLGKVLLLDEGGPSRTYGSLLVDSLPSVHRHGANYSSLSFLDLPEKKRIINWKNPKLLISFGGEDPEKLTHSVLPILLNELGIRPEQIGVVQGPIMDCPNAPAGVTIYKNLNDLTPLYESYDILVGSFGLTPLEAASAGCAVMLINPSSYHEKLSRHTGLLSAGVKTKGLRRLRTVYQHLIEEKIVPSLPGKSKYSSLVDFITALNQGGPSSCPVCLEDSNRVISRFQSRTYYHCRSCRNYYMVNWQEEEEIYDREYFFSRYKNQYGKTYLEDFEYIEDLGKVRLGEIEKIFRTGNKERKDTLLTDLGCAFGPFLSAAQKRGYACRGVEINKDGAEWVESNLNIPVIQGSLTEENLKGTLTKEKSHILTLWYVIEHMPDQKSLLKDLYGYLKPGGLLAFGTPSGRGISARKDKCAFLKASPSDHFVIYTPKGVRRTLTKAGFSVKKIKSVGHHPERFGKWVGKKGTITYNMVMLISRIFSLGDSLEVYALKADIKEQKK